MSDSVVNLNVGGSLYTTSRSTLCLYPDSMLGAMFKGTMPTTKDAEGRYLIDRDGPIFGIVLDFLRYNKLVLPHGFDQLDKLEADVSFYQIIPLETAVKELNTEHIHYSFILSMSTGKGISVAGAECPYVRIEVNTHENIANNIQISNWCNMTRYNLSSSVHKSKTFYCSEKTSNSIMVC